MIYIYCALFFVFTEHFGCLEMNVCIFSVFVYYKLLFFNASVVRNAHPPGVRKKQSIFFVCSQRTHTSSAERRAAPSLSVESSGCSRKEHLQVVLAEKISKCTQHVHLCALSSGFLLELTKTKKQTLQKLQNNKYANYTCNKIKSSVSCFFRFSIGRTILNNMCFFECILACWGYFVQ